MNNLINAVLNRKFQLFDFLEKKIPDHHACCMLQGRNKGDKPALFYVSKGDQTTRTCFGRLLNFEC